MTQIPQGQDVSEVYAFEVRRASNDELKQGITAAEVVKVLVSGEVTSWSAYKVAIAMAWRPDRMVTYCQVISWWEQ
jgi:hypothetical protein